MTSENYFHLNVDNQDAAYSVCMWGKKVLNKLTSSFYSEKVLFYKKNCISKTYMLKRQSYWKIWKKWSILQFLNALFFNSCKYEQLFSSSKVTRHIGLKLHQSVRRIGSERSWYVHNSIKRLFLVLKIAFFGPHLLKKGQKRAS